MSEKEKQEEKPFSSAKELFEHNQQKIIEKKESYYDKVIKSLNLTTGKLDILIIVLIALLILIFVFGSHR